jgi:GNAT superfamily N-acetyltransferase
MLTIRPATPADVPTILHFIRELATYEREPSAVIATEADLLRDGFTEPRRFHCLIADCSEAETENVPATPAGFALYFATYSTWEGHHGLYLEDLFVTPAFRGQGIGQALLSRVAALAIQDGCPRLEWSVLDWNAPAIDFYRRMGALPKSEWQGMRLSGEALQTLATKST